VTVTEFFKLYYKNNEKGIYGINKFGITEKGKILIEEIHFGNYYESLSDFFSDFPTDEDVETMKELNVTYSKKNASTSILDQDL